MGAGSDRKRTTTRIGGAAFVTPEWGTSCPYREFLMGELQDFVRVPE
jgi:hypothetical protein